MRVLKKPPRRLLFVALLLAVAGIWIVWNRPVKVDLSTYVPAECLGFIETDDLPAAASGIEGTEAWRGLAAPLGAPDTLLPSRWLITLARWTGIGSADAIVAARAQVAIVFTQPEASASEQTLTIKPRAALIIETHTTQRRMRSAIENHVREFADRAYGQSVFTRKQVGGVELADWASSNGQRHITAAFIDTTVVIGNDEATVLHCVEVRRGRAQSMAASLQLQQIRARLISGASIFGFVSKTGVQPIVQGWVLNRPGITGDQMIYAQLIAKTFSNLIESFGWSSSFDTSGTHDRCEVLLASGVGQQLASSINAQPISTVADFSFVPSEAVSVTSYQIKEPSSFWKGLDTVLSAHSDVLGAVAAHQVLRAVLQPYGIGDADVFFAAIGTRIQLVRLDKDSPPVLIADALDRPSLSNLAKQRLGSAPRNSTVNGVDFMISSDDRWAAAFMDNRFLIGRADAVRRCLDAKGGSNAIGSVASFGRARQLLDVSTPALAINFSDDKSAAISFVALFSKPGRSAFSGNGASVDRIAASLPQAVSVTNITIDAVEWDSRSAFGVLGSLFTTFGAENPH